MADIGKAGLLIVPRFNGLTEAVNKALKDAADKAGKPAEGIGEKAASGFGRGLGRSGVVIGAFSALTSKAMESVSSSVGAATSRFDTLNNYPRVMQSLGYSAKDAEVSISTMSDRLSVLPTRLDDMASTVQGLAVITGDLDKATSAGLALNDMLLASGSSTQLTAAAMEQFRQMLSKGKPEMEDWKSLTAAMPGQLDQLAKSMLGPTATANDLYAALGGGGKEAVVSMDALLDEIIRLDQEGGEGFDSFREQAETATGGVATSAANTANAVVKGLAGTMEAIGGANISGVMGDVKGAINGVFDVVNGGISKAMPAVENLYGHVKDAIPTVAAMAVGYTAASKAIELVGGAAGRLRMSLSPMNVGLGAASVVIGLVASAAMNAARYQENLRKATVGINDAVSRASSLAEYRGLVDGVGSSAEISALSVGELVDSMAGHVDAMNASSEAAESEIAKLNTARSTIEQYIGMTDLNTEAQGRLEWALGVVNDKFGLSISAADVAAGSYKDADGATRDLAKSIDELVEAKKREIEAESLATQLSEAYEMRNEAAATYAKERAGAMEEQQAFYESLVANGVPAEEAMQLAQDSTNAAIAESKRLYDEACEGVSALESEMGASAAAADESADAYDKWAGSLTGTAFAATIRAKGGLDGFSDALRTLGADTVDLSELSEDELLKIADAYDGSASSVVGVLEEIGVALDDEAAATARATADMINSINGMGSGVKTALDAAGVDVSAFATKLGVALDDEAAATARATADMINSINGMGSGVKTALDAAGVDVSAFATKLAEAGVSTEDLNAVGSENLAALAEACQGDMGKMVWAVQNYNNVPVIDKDGNVVIDDESLIDAQGNVYTWNGSAIVDKDGNAVVDDVDLMDAQGRLYTWNGSRLQSHQGSGRVNGNMSGAIADRNDWNSKGLNSYVASAAIDLFTRGTSYIGSTIRAHKADGGIRYHADGAFIATNAMRLGVHDVVGEDGAEAIVPLTNRRYSQPFADVIAEGVARINDQSKLIEAVNTLHGDLMAIYGAIPEGQSGRDRARAIRKAVEGVARINDQSKLIEAVNTLHGDLMAIYGAIPEGQSGRDRARAIRKAVSYAH